MTAPGWIICQESTCTCSKGFADFCRNPELLCTCRSNKKPLHFIWIKPQSTVAVWFASRSGVLSGLMCSAVTLCSGAWEKTVVFYFSFSLVRRECAGWSDSALSYNSPQRTSIFMQTCVVLSVSVQKGAHLPITLQPLLSLFTNRPSSWMLEAPLWLTVRLIIRGARLGCFPPNCATSYLIGEVKFVSSSLW